MTAEVDFIVNKSASNQDYMDFLAHSSIVLHCYDVINLLGQKRGPSFEQWFRIIEQMPVNIVGLVALCSFYLLILVVGVIAARKKKVHNGTTQMEQSIVAGRDISTIVGIFTMTATTVGGGYINGTAESIATAGLVWTLAPFGIFVGLISGGLIFARRMREQKYLTMLDPFQEVYGSPAVLIIYIASLCGDLFWTASILSALGTSLSVIVNIPLNVAIVTSSLVTVFYTMFGQMISVAYTDIVQLCLIIFGLTLSVPFVLTNQKTGNILDVTDQWIGQFDEQMTSQWLDLFVAMTFGTIPWQAYFQRVLSVRSGKEAQILSAVGGLSALVLVIPSVLIGAAAVTADWSNTTMGMSPMAANVSSMVLPYVLQEFTPTPVAILGLSAICAAVMSSMDSSILGSSSMFTNNIYKQILRQKADSELLWIQRLTILLVGAIATVISMTVPIIYGLFILAADIVFVIVFPQLICVVFYKWTNIYGSVVGYVTGVILRVGAGEPYINLEPFIFYPFYNENGQMFPFRTFAMVMSLSCILLVSMISNFVSSYVYSESSASYSVQDGENTENRSQTLLISNVFRKKDVSRRQSVDQELLSLPSSKSSALTTS
ncbi:hypothetical protein FSP39_018781 [Pinctada imbricata]|uniref:Uncharacterized protein n=1 Tax=Pinctada imbricata TaxID=66713 RepID=A0AA88YKW6_PINIB|nr:hypothetical protein FSP39_018781 [Pinctada imbricata]